MGFLTGSSSRGWDPELTADTTVPTYWLNWRVALCGIWVLIAMIMASYLISKYEGPRTRGGSQDNQSTRDEDKEEPGLVYADEAWKPCFKGMHPVWLLAYRVFAFCILFILLVCNVAVDGGAIMYYYTQWTFALVTIYFGLGSMLSMYGCYAHHNKIGGGNEWTDTENGHNTANIGDSGFKSLDVVQRNNVHRKIAGFWGYVFQIMFQMNAGAVMLTDTVFWLIIIPFLKTRNYDISFLIVNMHTVNLVFLLGDTAMNCLRFPWFRIAYFFLWTCFYVIFQWIVHACIYLWWPYPFLDLSSNLCPLWYSIVALMHIPCFGLFILVIKFKHWLLPRCFPQSYQCPK